MVNDKTYYLGTGGNHVTSSLPQVGECFLRTINLRYCCSELEPVTRLSSGENYAYQRLLDVVRFRRELLPTHLPECAYVSERECVRY